MQVRCSGQWLWQRIECALAAASASVAVLWSLMWLGMTSGTAAVVACVAAIVVAATCMRVRATPEIRLIWNGRAWSLAGAGSADPVDVQAVDVMFDGGRWLLLRLVGMAAPTALHWLWIADAQGTEFRALCTALYAQRSTSSPILPDQQDPH